MADKLLMRNEVPEELTWDLSRIYKTEEDMYADFEVAKGIAKKMVELKGKLNNVENIVKIVEYTKEFSIILDHVMNYVSLAVSVDYYNAHNLERNARVESEYYALASELTFIDSELLEQDEALLKEAMAQTKGAEIYFKDLLRKKPYQLNPEVEKAVASYTQILNGPYTVYEQTKLADMKFDNFTVDGKEYPLGYSLFEDDYEYEKDTKVRRAAFKAFSDKIRQYENTTATVYNLEVKRQKIEADMRGFNSVFESLLFSQNVSLDLYNRQIDLITEKLAPHMRKYAKLIQKIHKLDKMTYADLKLPLDPEYDPKVTIEESKKYIIDGLSILGDDYVEMIKTAYKERWVDFAKNQGKSTGGFCASPYQKGSYILLSWNDRMADVITLAHELGHAGHFKTCQSVLSPLETELSRYFIEAPSTMNELIMANYLIKTSEDKRFRRWVLSCIVGNTYYHNFVTHLLEAAYQREVYKLIDAGESVHAEKLNDIFKDVLTKFWGDDVELTEGAELTWMRQPHYYMGLYSYTYSAGLTLATQVMKRITNEGQTAVDDWKKVLAAGGTLDVVELAKLAKVDITTDAALIDTIEYIGSLIDEMCALTEEI